MDVLITLAIAAAIAFYLVRRIKRPGSSAGRGRAERADARLKGDGSFPVEVVGESSYRRNFVAIFGRRREDGVDEVVEAILAPEDDNPHDENAVQVRIAGRTVGHLSRLDAARYRALVEQGALPGGRVACKARVRGGWDRGPGDRGEFGVRLDFRMGRDPDPPAKRSRYR